MQKPTDRQNPGLKLTEFAAVALPVPLRKVFDYAVPAGCLLARGRRVAVRFGRQRLVGVVTALHDNPGVEASRIREIETSFSPSSDLPEPILRLTEWAAHYYHHPIGEVVAAALPAMLRQGRELHPVVETVVVTDAGDAADIETLPFGQTQMVGQPITMSRTNTTMAAHPPDRGEHTDEILAEIGLDADAIAGLRAKNVV